MAKILVVDDEQLICDLLRTVLGRYGHEVLTATGGREALELLRRHRPRITLLDLRMPEMDGIQVLKQIRVVDPEAAVMVLTGAGTDRLETQARELGVTDFLRKGLPLHILNQALERVMMQQPVGAPSPSSVSSGSPVGAPETTSILVADDELIIRDMLTQFLTLHGYRVLTAGNGQEALDLVMKEQPRVIVLDLYMPVVNGLEVLRELRAREYLGSIIVLTASQDEKLLLEALDLGPMDLMGKPVDLDRLLVAIQVSLNLSSAQTPISPTGGVPRRDRGL